jgi:putative ABC transport system substrate-binding protein
MKRRAVLAGLSVWPAAARAQTAAKTAHVAILAAGHDPASPILKAFTDELAKRSAAQGWNCIVEARLSQGDGERLRRDAVELVAKRVDVIVTDGSAASLAAQQATTTIPIVMGAIGDPIVVGLIKNLARPGGNITGFSLLAPQLGTKRLSLLKEAVPGLKRIGVLWNPESGGNSAQQLTTLKDAAPALDVELVTAPAHDHATIPGAIDLLAGAHVSAISVAADAVFFNDREQIVEQALAKRLPGIYPERPYADAGGLMAYGPDPAANFRAAAGYVMRILKGEKPGDLPVTQPAEFELVVNVRTAKELGLTLSPVLLTQATEVIE